MNRSKKIKIWLLAIFLPIALVVCIIWIGFSSINAYMQPDKEKMEEYLQRDKADIDIITDYLINSDYSYIYIKKADIKNEVMFTGAGNLYQKIDDKKVLKSLKKILCKQKYVNISKSNNTVVFEKWSFFEKDRGIAFPINNGDKPVVEYIIKSEPLSEPGWYYYECDYYEAREHFTNSVFVNQKTAR